MRLYKPRKHWTHQADAVLNQAAPVQNTYYVVLNGVLTELYTLSICVATANETLQVRITIDGVVYDTGTVAAIFDSWYQVQWCQPFGGLIVPTFDYDNTTPHMILNMVGTLKGKAVKVELRKTTATGAGNLKAIATHAKLV